MGPRHFLTSPSPLVASSLSIRSNRHFLHVAPEEFSLFSEEEKKRRLKREKNQTFADLTLARVRAALVHALADGAPGEIFFVFVLEIGILGSSFRVPFRMTSR